MEEARKQRERDRADGEKRRDKERLEELRRREQDRILEVCLTLNSLRRSKRRFSVGVNNVQGMMMSI